MFFLWGKLSVVYRWFTKFSSGKESVKDDADVGRSKSDVKECSTNKTYLPLKMQVIYPGDRSEA